MCYVVFPQDDPSETEPLTAKATDWGVKSNQDFPFCINVNTSRFRLKRVLVWSVKHEEKVSYIFAQVWTGLGWHGAHFTQCMFLTFWFCCPSIVITSMQSFIFHTDPYPFPSYSKNLHSVPSLFLLHFQDASSMLMCLMKYRRVYSVLVVRVFGVCNVLYGIR